MSRAALLTSAGKLGSVCLQERVGRGVDAETIAPSLDCELGLNPCVRPDSPPSLPRPCLPLCWDKPSALGLSLFNLALLPGLFILTAASSPSTHREPTWIHLGTLRQLIPSGEPEGSEAKTSPKQDSSPAGKPRTCQWEDVQATGNVSKHQLLQRFCRSNKA